MKRIRALDAIAFSYTLYFSITLALEPSLLGGDAELYTFMRRIHADAQVWGMGSLGISILYAVSFYFNKIKWLSVTANVLSGLFFILIGAAYMLTYPNIGSGIFTIIGILIFMNIGTIAITNETVRRDLKELTDNDNTEN